MHVDREGRQGGGTKQKPDPDPNAIPNAFGDFVRQITKGDDESNLMRQRAVVLVRHVLCTVGDKDKWRMGVERR
jgi:hypothetical protein